MLDSLGGIHSLLLGITLIAIGLLIGFGIIGYANNNLGTCPNQFTIVAATNHTTIVVKNWQLFLRDYAQNGTSQLNNNIAAMQKGTLANDTYMIEVFPNVNGSQNFNLQHVVNTTIANTASGFHLGVTYRSIAYYTALANLQSDLPKFDCCLLYVMYDYERGATPEFSITQSVADGQFDQALTAVHNYNSRTHADAKLIIFPSWLQVSSGVYLGNYFKPWDFGEVSKHVDRIGIQFNGFQDQGYVPLIINNTIAQMQAENPTSPLQIIYTVSTDPTCPKCADTASKWIWVTRDPHITDFHVFFSSASSNGATSVQNLFNDLKTLRNNGGTLSNTTTIAVGLYDKLNMTNDQVANSTFDKWSDNNDFFFGRASEKALFAHYVAKHNRILVARSMAEIYSGMNTTATWTVKPTTIEYEPVGDTSITPSSEQNNMANTTNFAAKTVHKQGYLFMWNPLWTSFYLPNENTVNRTNIDQVVFQVQKELNSTRPRPYSNDVVTHAHIWRNTLPAIFTTVIKPIGQNITGQTNMAVIPIDPPAMPISSQAKFGNMTFSANCGTRSTIATINTGFPAGNNTIILPVNTVANGTNPNIASIQLFRSGTLLAKPYYNIQMKSALTTGQYTILYLDNGAPSNAVYTVEGCSTNSPTSLVTGYEMATIVNNLPASAFVNGSKITTTAGVPTTVVSVTPTNFQSTILSNDTNGTLEVAPGNVIVASLELNNSGVLGIATNMTIPVGGIQLVNGGGGVLAQNSIKIELSNQRPSYRYSTTLIGTEYNMSNPTYSVKVNTPIPGLDVHATILAFQSLNGTGNNGPLFSNMPVNDDVMATAKMNLNFGSAYMMIERTQFYNNRTGTGSIAQGQERLEFNSGVQRSNQLAYKSLDKAQQFGGAFAGQNFGDVMVVSQNSPGTSPKTLIYPMESFNWEVAQIMKQFYGGVQSSTNGTIIYYDNTAPNGTQNQLEWALLALQNGVPKAYHLTNFTNTTTTTPGISTLLPNSCQTSRNSLYAIGAMFMILMAMLTIFILKPLFGSFIS